MNSRTIRRIRRKFIYSTLLTYFLVMLIMGVFINMLNLYSSHRQIYSVLAYILDNEGDLEDADDHAPEPSDPDYTDPLADDLPIVDSVDNMFLGSVDDFSSEFRYSTRYFTVLFDKNGLLIDLDTTNIAEIPDIDARVAARRIYSGGRKSGRTGFYFYQKRTLPDGCHLYAFVNCKAQIRSNIRIALITVTIAIFCLLATFLFIVLFSNRFIRPEIENAQRQKQFITNASHELKTPLAVIRANNEILEMMNGENEWSRSTNRQIDRLNVLIQNLVLISQAQEREDRSVMQEINVSASIDDSISPYMSLAQQDNVDLRIEIIPDIKMMADESKIRQLATLLIDNAFKYCDPAGSITVSLTPIRKGRLIRLAVSNSYASGANVNYSRFFERFYREDPSRNVDRGGYGIGLSIAESICQQYSGSISANWKDGIITFTCMLPA